MKHPVVSETEWIGARKQHLASGKRPAASTGRSAPAASRTALDEGRQTLHVRRAHGTETLADLFGTAVSSSCSISCSALTGRKAVSVVHSRRITSMLHSGICVITTLILRLSRARPGTRSQAFRQRMGWQFHWVSSLGSDFNYDFGVSFSGPISRPAASRTTSSRANSRVRKCRG